MKTAIITRILNYFRFVITGKSDNFVDANILDFSGQGAISMVDKPSSSIRASVLMFHRVFITLASNTRGEITHRAG